MKNSFVAIGLGAVIALAPLAAMAQSATGTAHAGGGGSHRSHLRHSGNYEQREGQGLRPNICARCATPLPLPRADLVGAGEIRPLLPTPGYFTGQGFAPQISCAYCPIVRSLENLPEPARLRMTFSVHSFGLRWSSQSLLSA